MLALSVEDKRLILFIEREEKKLELAEINK
jgi:hypothetical protein